MNTMTAAHITENSKTTFIEIPVPEPEEGFALVRPLKIAICGSDLRKVFHLDSSSYPLPPGVSGHEVIGVVEKMFPSTETPTAVAEGQTVLSLIPRFENAMSEYVTTEIENLLPLPEGPESENRLEHLLMAQQLGTVIFACKKIPSLIGKTAVIMGQGSAGLFFDTMLRRLGAQTVIACDLLKARLSVGETMGATTTLNASTIDIVEAVKDLTHGQGADLVVEAVGDTETVNQSIQMVKKDGQLHFFGIPHKTHFEIDFQTFFRSQCYATASSGAGFEKGKLSTRLALELIDTGEIDVKRLVTHRLPFEKVAQAYRTAHTGAEGAVKVLVQMPGT